jgi:sec-independent protein translocase protein TatB
MFPQIGFSEMLLLGLIALIVVGPKDLPLLMRKAGKAMAKLRSMASEFRSSFDELARQAEIDELRREVDALRTGQAFQDIKDEVTRPFDGLDFDEYGNPRSYPPEPSAPPNLAPSPEPPAAVAAPDPTPAPAAEPAKPKAARARKKAQPAEAKP